MAMQRIANPWISVRLRVPPPTLFLILSVSFQKHIKNNDLQVRMVCFCASEFRENTSESEVLLVYFFKNVPTFGKVP